MIWGETTDQMLKRVFGKHKWFAWYPVKLEGGKYVWWETVWKKRYGSRGGGIWAEYFQIDNNA